jgi:hypothetical protein
MPDLKTLGALRGKRKFTPVTTATPVTPVSHAARAVASRRGFGLPGITKKPTLADIAGLRRRA